MSEFKPEDFVNCYWWIWAPLIWPSIVGIEVKSYWQLLSEKKLNEEFLIVWDRFNLSNLFAIMTSTAFGQPPSWSLGLHCPQLVSQFLSLQELISRFQKKINICHLNDSAPMNFGVSQFNWEECVNTFERISSYLPPAQERLTPIFDWIAYYKSNQAPTSVLMERIQRDELQKELEAYQSQPKPIHGVVTEPDDNGEVYCPRCGGALRMNAISKINRGKLTLCSTSSDAWLFKTERLPKQII